jgi:hypothetical protein
MLTRRLAVLSGVLVLGAAIQAGELFGENLVQVKLALPKGDTYIRGETDPVANLMADVTLTNVTEKEKRQKEPVAVTRVNFMHAEELIALEEVLKKAETKDAMMEAINAATGKKKGQADIEVYPVNPKSIGVAYAEPAIGASDTISFVITKLPEEGEAVPEGAKPAIVEASKEVGQIGQLDASPLKYLAAGESSPAYTLPVGRQYLIRQPGLYSIKARMRWIGDTNTAAKVAESNEEKFRVLSFKVVDATVDTLKRNWEAFERGYPAFDHMIYQVKDSVLSGALYTVQRIMVRGTPTWEWRQLCSVKPGTQALVAFLAPKKYALLATHASGEVSLYTLDFNPIGGQVTQKAVEAKAGATPQLKVEGGAPSVEWQ